MIAALAEVGAGGWAFGLMAVTVAACLQRLTGQGFGMIAAPLVTLIAPQMLPTCLLILGAVVGWSATRADFSQVRLRELPPGMAGRALGAVIAAVLAAQIIGSGGIGVAIALVVFLAIALSLAGLRVPITPATLFGAGVTAGIMGTLTAIGAPPTALLYQHEARARSAAMQNTFFLFGMVVSFAALAWQGLVRAEQIWFALALAPGVPLGLWLSRPVAARTAHLPIRPVALGLAGASAALLLIRSV